MVIERGASNTLVVMGRVTLSPSYWLLHFTDIERGSNAYCVVQAGNSSASFISLTFTETTSPVALDGEVLLSPPGNWNLKIYEQTSSTNLVPASANRLVKDVDVFVDGAGVADSGWTETCPTDEDCDPLSVRVNGETYGTVADPCGGIATVTVTQDGTQVGSLVGGVWVIPTCDPFTVDLVNTDDDLLESQEVDDCCGQTVKLLAPDGAITFDGLDVGTVVSGGTTNLDCGTLLDAAYVEDGGSVTGTYLVTGTLNGREVYTLDGSHNLEYTGTRWRLVKPGSDVDAALGSETFPWQADWSATSVTVQQATIGAYCGGEEVPCADLTVAINGTTYGTVADPCGATAAVDVHDSNGNDVGSLVSGSWVVAPPANVLREFTTGGSWSKPTDASFKGVWVFAAGAGGSGGAGTANVSTQVAGGGGGGGGSIVRRWIAAASLLTTETYAIGAGAAGVATGAGTAGGATLFGAHAEAKGGSGGTAGTTAATAGGGAGGNALLNVPIASGASISGGVGGSGLRSGPTTATNGMITTAGAGGGGGGGRATALVGNGTQGGGCYNNGSLTAGGAGGIANGGNGTAGVSDIYLDPFLGLVTATIGIGTAGGGGAGNDGASAVGGNGAAGGRAAGGGGGGSQGNGAGGTPGASGAGGNGFLLVYEVFAI
jgi:hypothetical protein